MRGIICALLMLIASPLAAQTQVVLARAGQAQTQLSDGWGGQAHVAIGMTQAVPYRVQLLKNPKQVLIEFETLVLDGLDLARIDRSDAMNIAQIGTRGPRITFMLIDLAGPMRISNANLTVTDATGSAYLEITLDRVDDATFDRLAVDAAQSIAGQGIADIATPKKRWVVVLDPGHGGVDSGARNDGVIEADLMLLFAFELREALRRTGFFDVVLTRERDVFLGLEDRMSIARDAGAAVFLSLHADAVPEPYVNGATTYVLSSTASSEADAKLAARHNRSDIISGVDLHNHGDDVALILLEMARRETTPKTNKLAQALVKSIGGQGGHLNSKPFRHGDFAVLRSADIPSVLLELGFLSSADDRNRLSTPQGRRPFVNGIVEGLVLWAADQAATAALIRQ